MHSFRIAPLALFLCLNVALAQAPPRDQKSIAYLQELQDSSGGFRMNGERTAKPSLRATIGALRALKYFHGTVPDREKCTGFVKKCFDRRTGGFADHPEETDDVASTAVGVLALVELEIALEEYHNPVIGYLETHVKNFEDIRIAAAAFEAAAWTSPRFPTWIAKIEAMRNEGGTYGKDDGEARATASAAVAILRLGGKLSDRQKVLNVLHAGQRTDGGFGKPGIAGSDLESCYRVVRAFAMLKKKPDVQRCLHFVASCRNEDGGYGGAPGQGSTVSTTYYAAIIRHWLTEP
jgi:prenyltransferase beta subunit